MSVDGGGLPNVPVEAIEMLEQGKLTLRHDPNYVKGVVSLQLTEYAWKTYHQNWMIVRNSTGFPFITSDNPVSIHQPDAFSPAIRHLPITPRLCLSVRYDRTRVPDFDPKLPPSGAIEWVDADAQLARSINTLTAKCAEDFVFTTRPSAGIRRLVQNNARFGLECDLMTLGSLKAEYHQVAVRVRERRK